MERERLQHLPMPIARALEHWLDEELSRSADELAELVAVVVEYVAAVALADYLDATPEDLRTTDPALPGWLISQLASGKTEVGLWARWTQRAAKATPRPAVASLAAYIRAQDIDNPNSDLSRLLAFRNSVMHGGFIAPLRQIHATIPRLRALLDDLSDLFAMRPVARCPDSASSPWSDMNGLQPSPCAPPTGLRPGWDTPGAVLLVDPSGTARLALHPACVLDDQGHLQLQRAWKTAHPALFETGAVADFFQRYQRERRGQVDATDWHDRLTHALPPQGYVSQPARERALSDLLARERVIRLVGPPGSGRSTLARQVLERSNADRPFFVLPVEAHTLRQDPEVVARWTLQALSSLALGDAPPASVLAADTHAAVTAWFERLSSALASQPTPVLVIDDAHLVGGGLYAESPSTSCLRHARRFGATVLLIHTPSGTPPEQGDAALELAPLEDADLQAWGEPQTLRARTAGHLDLLAHPLEGRNRLIQRLHEAFGISHLSERVLRALTLEPRSATEVAERVTAFTPQVELTLRALLDHLVVTVRPSAVRVVTSTRIGRERTAQIATTERAYALHPATALALSELSR